MTPVNHNRRTMIPGTPRSHKISGIRSSYKPKVTDERLPGEGVPLCHAGGATMAGGLLFRRARKGRAAHVERIRIGIVGIRRTACEPKGSAPDGVRGGQRLGSFPTGTPRTVPAWQTDIRKAAFSGTRGP